MQAELMQEAIEEDQDFRYGIAKIRYGHIFAMIVKIRYHSENSLS